VRLTDPYGRPLESMRVAVTQSCNLRCFYCHQEGELQQSNVEMTPEEIERIVSVAASFGVDNVKLTGGEPLVRTDILEIVRRVKSVLGIREVSMTTNGVLLGEYAKRLKQSGLSRVNVSLDTLEPRKFAQITGAAAMEAVLSGIERAVEAGLRPLKVNMVLLKGVNEDETADMIDFAVQRGLILQIIELESPNEDELYEKHHAELDVVESYLKENAESVTVRRMHHRKKYQLRNGGEVEIVRPMHNTEFCRYCNRIRVTSDGRLKPCLFRNDNLVDILRPLREGASEETLKNLFLEAVKRREPYFK